MKAWRVTLVEDIASHEHSFPGVMVTEFGFAMYTPEALCLLPGALRTHTLGPGFPRGSKTQCQARSMGSQHIARPTFQPADGHRGQAAGQRGEKCPQSP